MYSSMIAGESNSFWMSCIRSISSLTLVTTASALIPMEPSSANGLTINGKAMSCACSLLALGFLPGFFFTCGCLGLGRLRTRTLFLPHVIKNSDFHCKLDPAIGCVTFIISFSNEPLRLHKFSASHVVGCQGRCVD